MDGFMHSVSRSGRCKKVCLCICACTRYVRQNYPFALFCLFVCFFFCFVLFFNEAVQIILSK